MRTRLTLLPGDRGAKQLHEQYGEQLVCVRYRYDEPLQKRFKTVELIVGETDWLPPASQRQRNSVVSGDVSWHAFTSQERGNHHG